MSNPFADKTAIISGGAGGIGFAIAQELGQAGMNIVLADIDADQLLQAEQTLTDQKITTLTCPLDVTDYDQWLAVVQAAEERFNDIHLLVNNAGVGGIPGSIEDTNHETWRWVMDVNLMGVVYGTQAVTPAIKRHQQGGWIVNVASMAGMIGVPFAGAYTASKAAVVAMSESWAAELKPDNIHVSVLCPAFVKTRIHESHRNRQARYKSSPKHNTSSSKQQTRSKSSQKETGALVESGIPSNLVAQRVLEALKSKQTYIFTHPNYQPVTAKRAHLIDKAFEDSKNSPLVTHLQGDDIQIL